MTTTFYNGFAPVVHDTLEVAKSDDGKERKVVLKHQGKIVHEFPFTLATYVPLLGTVNLYHQPSGEMRQVKTDDKQVVALFNEPDTK